MLASRGLGSYHGSCGVSQHCCRHLVHPNGMPANCACAALRTNTRTILTSTRTWTEGDRQTLALIIAAIQGCRIRTSILASVRRIGIAECVTECFRVRPRRCLCSCSLILIACSIKMCTCRSGSQYSNISQHPRTLKYQPTPTNCSPAPPAPHGLAQDSTCTHIRMCQHVIKGVRTRRQLRTPTPHTLNRALGARPVSLLSRTSAAASCSSCMTKEDLVGGGAAVLASSCNVSWCTAAAAASSRHS